MIEHVRRKLASMIPVAPEASILLSAVLQTTVAGIFLLTLRFGSVLVAGVVVAVVVRPEVISLEALMTMTVAAWSDRSAVS
ncbi:hypothetical protein [Streptomyces radiopugnans]|uniref:hypothetical protein n=1 Tax=Streptomyces radiopugnans TaxID=403935 RepID=UPI003F1C4CE6